MRKSDHLSLPHFTTSSSFQQLLPESLVNNLSHVQKRLWISCTERHLLQTAGVQQHTIFLKILTFLEKQNKKEICKLKFWIPTYRLTQSLQTKGSIHVSNNHFKTQIIGLLDFWTSLRTEIPTYASNSVLPMRILSPCLFLCHKSQRSEERNCSSLWQPGALQMVLTTALIRSSQHRW